MRTWGSSITVFQHESLDVCCSRTGTTQTKLHPICNTQVKSTMEKAFRWWPVELVAVTDGFWSLWNLDGNCTYILAQTQLLWSSCVHHVQGGEDETSEIRKHLENLKIWIILVKATFWWLYWIYYMVAIWHY